MIFIRSLLYFILMVLSVVIFGLLISTVGWVLPQSARDHTANAWGKFNLVAMRLLCRLDYRIQGWENLGKINAIVMAKHQSTWETISLRGLLPANQTWVLKKELMQIPIFGWALAAVKPIAINRKAGKKAARQIIELGTKLLDEGRWVIIFPEGTRTALGEKKKYGIGGGLLAEKSGYPVIPIAHNAGLFWKRRGVKKYPGTIDVVIGSPITTEGKTASAITREVQQWIETQMDNLPDSLD